MRLNTPSSALTETSILYTDGHMNRQTDMLFPVYPRKPSFCGAIIIKVVIFYFPQFSTL